MKKILFSLFTFLFSLFTFIACDPVVGPNIDDNNGNNPPKDTTQVVDTIAVDPVGTTYPRVQLIEHFTGATCGYCPIGMDYIDEVYSQAPESYVWVSNHYGYQVDDYTITGSSTIAKKLWVSSAPSMSINRSKQNIPQTGQTYNYHPGYISQIMPKMAKTATEKISLTRTYNAATNALHVVATVITSREDFIGAKLTLGVIESGPEGIQQDYYGSWEGWKKFTHTHVIRVYATAALGDTYAFYQRAFAAEYDITMKDDWVAENCEIVAWITPDDNVYEVLNAAKLPVVEGTDGGESIRHGGIEAVPVSDDYPEEGSPAAEIAFTEAFAEYQPAGDGNTVFELIARNLTKNVGSFTYSGTRYDLFPYLDMMLYVEGNVTSIPVGEYPIKALAERTPNCVIAGLRNETEFSFDWSQLYYVYNSGGLYSYSLWLLEAGTLTVTTEGFTFSATTLNGSQFTAAYTGAIPCSRAQANAPKKVQRK